MLSPAKCSVKMVHVACICQLLITSKKIIFFLSPPFISHLFLGCNIFPSLIAYSSRYGKSIELHSEGVMISSCCFLSDHVRGWIGFQLFIIIREASVLIIAPSSTWAFGQYVCTHTSTPSLSHLPSLLCFWGCGVEMREPTLCSGGVTFHLSVHWPSEVTHSVWPNLLLCVCVCVACHGYCSPLNEPMNHLPWWLHRGLWGATSNHRRGRSILSSFCQLVLFNQTPRLVCLLLLNGAQQIIKMLVTKWCWKKLWNSFHRLWIRVIFYFSDQHGWERGNTGLMSVSECFFLFYFVLFFLHYLVI